MRNPYSVIWTCFRNIEVRGSAPTLEDAIWMTTHCRPRDAISVVVKLGRKIVHRTLV